MYPIVDSWEGTMGWFLTGFLEDRKELLLCQTKIFSMYLGLAHSTNQKQVPLVLTFLHLAPELLHFPNSLLRPP